MGKNTHFFGQPIFSQLLSFVDKSILSQVKAKHQSDRYYKKFDTWQHLVTMLYCSFSGATSLRELSTGLRAWQNKLVHIGMPSSPKRATISDGNSKRPSGVFKDIYMGLFEKYRHILPDSRLKMEVIKKLFIVDSTVISLFKDILKVAGRPRKDGRSKGGIKAHVMIHAAELMPCLVRFTEGSRHDHTFLKHLNVSEGSYIVMDKGYTDYLQIAQWTDRGIYFITRMKDNAIYEGMGEFDLPDDKDHEILPTYQKGVKGKYQLVVKQNSWESLKRKLKQITKKTSPPRRIEELLKKLVEVWRGWVNNYRLASISAKLKSLDEWLRNRLRYCIWSRVLLGRKSKSGNART